MLCLIHDPSEMSTFVVEQTELFDLIPKLTPEHKEDLECILSFQEVTKELSRKISWIRWSSLTL